MAETNSTLDYVLEHNRWMCSCGADFDEPEQLVGHRTSMRNKGVPTADHSSLGYGSRQSGEVLLKTGHKVWKGRWKTLLAKNLGISTDERATEPEDGAGESKEPSQYNYEDTEAEFNSMFEDSDEEPDGRASNEDPELDEVQVDVGTSSHRVKVAYRPTIFTMDEAVVHLYHLHQAAAQRLGVRYNKPLGEWIREVVFQFTLEHPELVDLSTILTPQQRELIAGGIPGGRN